jgi:hypothetical protein
MPAPTPALSLNSLPIAAILLFYSFRQKEAYQ